MIPSRIWGYNQAMKRYLLIFCLALNACSDPNERANADFIDAVQLIEQAESEDSAKTTYSLLLEARETLNEIVTKYPSSDMAVKLASGEAIGLVSMQSLDVMIEIIRQKPEYCFEEPDYDCVMAIAVTIAIGIGDEWQGAYALAEIAAAQAEAGDMKAALQTASGIDDEGWKAYALAGIAAAQAEAGDMKAALQTASGIDDERQGASALAGIATAQADAGDMKAALQTASGIDDEGWKANVLAKVATAQAMKGGRRGGGQAGSA